MEHSVIRDDRSRVTRIPPCRPRATRSRPTRREALPVPDYRARHPCPLLAESPCRHHAVPSAPHSALAWPLIPHGATRRAPPGARQGPPECAGCPIHGKTARHPWPAEEPDCSRLFFRGPVSGRLASSRRKAPANRAAHRGPLDCSRPGVVRARVRLRLTPARV